MALDGIRSNIRLKDGVESICESGICRRDEEDLENRLDLVEEQLMELTRGMITKNLLISCPWQMIHTNTHKRKSQGYSNPHKIEQRTA